MVLPTMLARLFPFLSDALPDWCPPEVGLPNAGVRDAADALEDPSRPGVPPFRYQTVNLEKKAALEKYENGKVKRTRYPVVPFGTRKVVIGLHQAGVERSESRWMKTAHRVTCHRAIGPTGYRYRVHPLDRRLVCTNRLDRAPWHCIGVEVLGNFKGTQSGGWYKPERFGRGELGAAQLEALRQEIEAIVFEVSTLGGVVIGIAPHRVAGQGRDGKPNRQICCGYEVWQGAGEWAGATLGLRVPRDGWEIGGLPIPDEWHGPHWDACTRFFE